MVEINEKTIKEFQDAVLTLARCRRSFLKYCRDNKKDMDPFWMGKAVRGYMKDIKDPELILQVKRIYNRRKLNV